MQQQTVLAVPAEFDLDSRLRGNDGGEDIARGVEEVKIRKESFGGIAKRGDDIVYLNDRGYRTLMELKKVQSFSWKSHSFPTMEERDVFNFVSRMLQKKFFRVSLEKF